MQDGMNLGYLVFGVRKPRQWDDFCKRMLGLPAPVRNADGSSGWRLDGWQQRLLSVEHDSDDLLALGWMLPDDAALDRLSARMRAHGVHVDEAAAADCAARRVRRLMRLRDPAGNVVELAVGPELAAQPFASQAFPRGFVTGPLGLGHAVLVSPDLEAQEEFYGLLGLRVTERLHTRAGPVQVRGVFLHCNRRHHSLALFDLPSRKRLHHFMLQVPDHMDVGRAFERAREAGAPLSLSLGQHPDPDGTFSFYGATPSGFDFEIGAGTREIDPAGWKVADTAQTSSWGHEPQWRLKLRMVGALLSRRRGAPAIR